MGAFSEVLGIRPWEVERLTGEEFHVLADYVEKRMSGG